MDIITSILVKRLR